MKWIELAVEVHPEAVDAVANVFHENGTRGVAIEQPIVQDRALELEPKFVGRPVVKAYVPDTDEGREHERHIEEALWHLQAFDLSPIGPIRRDTIDDQDWVDLSKQHFHPLRIGRVVIKPSWREWDLQPDDILIEMDPGMAFGTGDHPTTHLTLEAMVERVRPGMHVLDLGTGSGILAMAAARLGARVDAVEIDEVAVDVAKRNITHNGLDANIDVMHGTVEAVLDRRYDLVLANIIASVLVDIAVPLARVLRPDADLLASGIIDERVQSVRDAFASAGMTVVEERRGGDWWLLIARRQR